MAARLLFLACIASAASACGPSAQLLSRTPMTVDTCTAAPADLIAATDAGGASYTPERHTVKDVFIHPQYDGNFYDVAVLRLGPYTPTLILVFW